MGTEIVKRSTPIGELRIVENRLVSGTVELLEKVIKLPAKGNAFSVIQGKALLGPEGLSEVNRYCGLSFQELREPMYSGESVDPFGYKTVTVSWMVSGYSPLGRPVVMGPLTLTYSPGDYFKRKLSELAQVKRWNGKFKEVDKKATLESAPVIIDSIAYPPERPGRWRFFPVDTASGLWADLSEPAVMDAYTDYLHNTTFAKRLADAICRRNLACQHPAGPPKYLTLDQDGNAIVKVWCWVPVRDSIAACEDRAKAISAAIDPRRVIDAEVVPCHEVDHGELQDELAHGAADLIDVKVSDDDQPEESDPWGGEA